MKIAFVDLRTVPTSGALVLPLTEGAKWPDAVQKFDRDSGGALSRAAATGRFKGKKGQTLSILAPANLAAAAALD